MLRWMLAALLALGGGGAAGAEEHRPLLPGIGAEDDRRAVDQDAAPWRALGRVQLEIGGRCTGALIGPRTVLTAAHCLVSRRSGRFVQPGTVHFLLGYRTGEWAGQARVTHYATGAFRPGQGPVGADWALLTLDRPLGPADRILPLLRQVPPPRTPAMLGGYQQDRPEVVLADTGCRLLGLQREEGAPPMLVHDCTGTRGVSGAPLLVRLADGGWAIAGIASATQAGAARGRAVPAPAIQPSGAGQ